MRMLSAVQETCAGVRRIVTDGLIVGRIRIKLLQFGYPVHELSDAEVHQALADGLFSEMLRRSTAGSVPPASVKALIEQREHQVHYEP